MQQIDSQQLAARRLYDAEIALHIARQTHVDAWIGAAADRLHEAVVAYRCCRPRPSEIEQLRQAG